MSRLILIAICLSCLLQCVDSRPVTTPVEPPKMEVVAVQLDRYLPLLEGKRVALVVNHTSLAGDVHLADTLKSRGVNLVKIFAPEHGFRGTADPGEHIEDGVDRKLGLPVVSLYGNNRKPTSEQLT